MPDDASRSPITEPIKRVTLARDDGGQILHIPKELEFSGTEVSLQRVGDTLVLSPIVRKPTLLEVLATMKPLPPEDWIELPDDPPPEPVDL